MQLSLSCRVANTRPRDSTKQHFLSVQRINVFTHCLDFSIFHFEHDVVTRLLCFGADADLGPGSAGNMGSNHGEW